MLNKIVNRVCPVGSLKTPENLIRVKQQGQGLTLTKICPFRWANIMGFHDPSLELLSQLTFDCRLPFAYVESGCTLQKMYSDDHRIECWKSCHSFVDSVSQQSVVHMEFQFKSVLNLEFQAKFGIELGIPIPIGINLGECIVCSGVIGHLDLDPKFLFILLQSDL